MKWAFLAIGFLLTTHTFAQTENPDFKRAHEQIVALYKQGKDTEGIDLAERSVAHAREHFGPHDPQIVELIYDLGRGFTRTGDYIQARKFYEEALQIRMNKLGEDHPDTATSKYLLAWFESDMANYDKALDLFHQALAFRKKHDGENHPKVAECYNSLAVLSQNRADYSKAEEFYLQALEIQKKSLNPLNPSTATTINNLGTLYWIMGEYEKAEPFFLNALEIRQKKLGEEHHYTATTLNNLALLYRSMGDFQQAEPLFKKVLKMRQKLLGPLHAFTITSTSNLGELYSLQDKLTEAEPLLTTALERRLKVLGHDHPDTARSMHDLGMLYLQQKNFNKSEPLLRDALQAREKTLGNRHPETALSQGALALHYHQQGKFSEAEKYYRLALHTERTVQSTQHPDWITNAERLAYLLAETDRLDEAQKLSDQILSSHLTRLNSIFSFTSESQRLEFKKSLQLFNLPASLGDVASLKQSIFKTKGLVLDSLIEDELAVKASDDPEIQQLLNDLKLITRCQQHPDSIPSEWQAEAKESHVPVPSLLSRKQRQTLSRFNRKISGMGQVRRALQIEGDKIESQIPQEAAFIEFIRYENHLGKLQFEPHYAALLILPSSDSKLIRLGKADDIEKQVAAYQRLVRSGTSETEMRTCLKGLYSKLIAPIHQILPSKITKLIISPDADLNFISFGTLLSSDDHFLLQQYTIQYVTTARDLIGRASATPSSNDLAIFADPHFGAVSGIQATATRWKNLTPLPGTREEAKLLREVTEPFGFTSTNLFGAEASKIALLRIRPPKILHLATHGFFLSEKEGPPGDARQILDTFTDENTTPSSKRNPMERSVLALAGAQQTFDAWKRGVKAEPDNDGIVTAQDVSTMNLRGTWLVVLSACDTGYGEASTGEGVLGLRRGFYQAGAQNLVMTLWPVSDRETSLIIRDFYKKALETKSPSESMVMVQKYWLSTLLREKGLVTAVRIAGPFILSSQAN
jgi:CHAT domain-containing protein/Tfp pilus assembly protein PilF